MQWNNSVKSIQHGKNCNNINVGTCQTKGNCFVNENVGRDETLSCCCEEKFTKPVSTSHLLILYLSND